MRRKLIGLTGALLLVAGCNREVKYVPVDEKTAEQREKDRAADEEADRKKEQQRKKERERLRKAGKLNPDTD